MAQELRTFSDIVAAVREETKTSSADTTAVNRIKRDINIVYREIIAFKRWWWLVEATNINIPAFYSAGTCQVVHGSSLVTFSQPIYPPKEGYFFAIEGDNEVYTVESHTQGASTLRLSTVFNGPTQLTVNFKIWTDRIPLPTNCKETVEVISPFTRQPLENMGLQEYRRISSGVPKRQGNPEIYYTGDFFEPFPDSAIANMPSLLHHKSDGVVKTLIFNSALPASITANTQLRIKGASHPSYNGEVAVTSVTTTNVTNDTLIYTGFGEYTEQTTPDAGISIRKLENTANRSRYRALFYYPSITSSNLTFSLDYQKNVPPLENDEDEPIIPLDDRIVLLYGALNRTWDRERNPEAATKNYGLYQNQLNRMAGQMQDSLDKPILKVARSYLGSKRSSFRSRRFNLAVDGFLGAVGGSTGGNVVAVLGAPNSVAQFNASGELEGSSVISIAELNYLDGASSNIQTQINTINSTISSAFVTNALVSNTAAIARSKLAAGTANVVPVNNGSGVLTDSAVTATELSFLSGVTPLTSVTLTDNTAVAADAVSISASNTFCFIPYSIKRNTSYEGGFMVLLNDGTTADLTIDSSNIGTNGVTLSAVVSGGNVKVQYTTTNMGFNATLKYAVIKWAA